MGEEVLVQNIKSKLWDQKGIISEVRLVHDGRIVSYELEVNGHNSTRHRRYLRKIPAAESVATSNSDHSVTHSSEPNLEPVLEQGECRKLRSSRPQDRQ